MIVLSFIALLTSVVICLASLRSKRGDSIGLPLVAIGTFIFLYVVQPLILLRDGDAEVFLTRGQIAWAILVPAIMLPCFVIGWNREPLKLVSTHVRCTRRGLSNPRGLWNFGFVTGVIGLSMYIIFLDRSGGILQAYSSAHGGAMAWDQNTAYLYDGPFWVLSGAAMMMYASSSFNAGGWRKAALMTLLAPLIADALLMGSRGILFSTCGAVFAGRAIAARKLPTLKQAFVALGFMGLGVLMMLGYRNVLHLGGDAQEAPTFDQALGTAAKVSASQISHEDTGIEFLYHGALLSTVDQRQKYGLGLQWIYWVALNPIPHLLWPEKHYPESPEVTNADIHEVTGVTVDYGSRAGIVAETYAEFGLAEGIFLYWFAKLSRRLFGTAWRLESLIAFCAYVMIYSQSLNIFAQGFQTIFVPVGYSMIPVVLYSLWARTDRRRAFAFARQRRFLIAAKTGQIQCS